MGCDVHETTTATAADAAAATATATATTTTTITKIYIMKMTESELYKLNWMQTVHSHRIKE